MCKLLLKHGLIKNVNNIFSAKLMPKDNSMGQAIDHVFIRNKILNVKDSTES